MNDGTEAPVAGQTAEADADATKRRLEELKAARNEMLENMDPSMGGASEDVGPITENGTDSTGTAAVAGEIDGRKEVSAATIGRMMGLVTLSEFKLMENKVDLLSTRMNSILVKMDKVLTTLETAPTGSDLDRIDVQIGAVKTMLKETLATVMGNKAQQSDERVSDARILSNND